MPDAGCRPHTLSPVSRAAPTSWTTKALLAWMGQAFDKAGLDAPRMSAELLLAHVLGCERLKLYMDADRPASELERSALRDLVKRALDHEPVQYLTQEAWFFGRKLHVDRRVLIPRQSSSCLIEAALEHFADNPGLGGKQGDGALIADICTGSGALAIALLTSLKGARGVATDISADAIEVARINAESNGVTDRLDLIEGNLLSALDQHTAASGNDSLACLVANPPYIPDNEWETPGMVGENVKGHEPDLALRGGPDGMKFVRPLIEQGPKRLDTDGILLIETADSTAAETCRLAKAHPMLTDVRMLKDHEGLPRGVSAIRK